MNNNYTWQEAADMALLLIRESSCTLSVSEVKNIMHMANIEAMIEAGKAELEAFYAYVSNAWQTMMNNVEIATRIVTFHPEFI